MEVVDQVDRVQHAVERPGDMGHDRAQDEHEQHGMEAHEAQALDDLAPDRRRGAPGRARRFRRPDEEQRDSGDRERDAASTRIANGALNSWTRPPARPGPPISAIDELVASLLLPSTTRSRPISDGT